MNNVSKIRNYLVGELSPMLKLQYLREDIGAAIALVFVAIPLSLAVSLATNVSPDMALVSAVVGGILGAIFGGCRLGVTGPAVGMSVLLADVIARSGFAGVLCVGLICGILQVTAGLLRFGRLAKYIPLSLVLAFGAGIGFLLFFKQLPNVFQLHDVGYSLVDTVSHIPLYWSHISSSALLIAILTVLILAVVPRFLPRSYAFFFAVLIPMFLVSIFNLNVEVIGSIPHDYVQISSFDFSSISDWHRIFLTSIEVFLLASLETLLSTSSVDLMGQGDLHNPNQELVGQGIANIGTAIFGGIPVSGLIARSSVNVLAGAKTRRAAIFHSLLILLVIYLFPHAIDTVPIAVLAGILIAAAFKMMNFRQLIDMWKSDRLDVLVYIITFIAIIGTDLIDGIQTGLLAAFIIVGIRVLRTRADIKIWTNNNVLRVGLSGNITFLSQERLAKVKELVGKESDIHFVVFEFTMLQAMDSSGAKILINIANDLREMNIKTIFHGASDDIVKIIKANTFTTKPSYEITITEYQIKDILEKSGFKHSANDVLRHGVTKYVTYYAKDNQELLNTLAQGQKPHTLLITCSDSRLNPNAFFSANIGELFIVRNVGNVVPPYMPDNIYSEIAAIEYAVSELGVRNIVICGHTECGAVKASYATGDEKLGYVGLDNWLQIIKDGFKINQPTDARHGVNVNLLHQVENLKTYPKINALLATSQITVNAWIYDVHSGHMLEWDDAANDFVQMV